METPRIKTSGWPHLVLAILWMLLSIILLCFLTIQHVSKIMMYNTTLTENFTTVLTEMVLNTSLGFNPLSQVLMENVTTNSTNNEEKNVEK